MYKRQGFIEAGKSLGIQSKIIFYKIQVPIAIRQSLPAYGNEIILMMKGTSLASTVTLMDLTGVAKYIISTTFKPIEVFIVAGGIYLFMTFIIHNFIINKFNCNLNNIFNTFIILYFYWIKIQKNLI